ncbi:MAG: GspL/Epsl periplasmic domain-containing protein, partial [Steroidobacteraceae bacterium]
NARQQMEGRLGLSQTSGAARAGLLESLGALGNALTQVPSTSLSSISYRDTILDLKLAAPDVASLDKITKLIMQRGFAATLEGTNQQGPVFEGRLQIRGAGKT